MKIARSEIYEWQYSTLLATYSPVAYSRTRQGKARDLDQVRAAGRSTLDTPLISIPRLLCLYFNIRNDNTFVQWQNNHSHC